MIEAKIFLGYSIGLIAVGVLTWMLYYSIPRLLKENSKWDIETRAGCVVVLALITVLDIMIVLMLTGQIILPEKLEKV